MKTNTKILRYGLYALFGGGLLLSVGCAPQSNYKKPVLDIPDHYKGQDTLSSPIDSVGIASIEWKEFFEDEQLVELITQGLAFNFDFKMALNNLEMAQLQASQAKLEWLPSINATIAGIDYAYRSKDVYNTASSKYYKDKEVPTNMYLNASQHKTGLALSWELDIWGKIKSRSAMALAQYLKTNEAKKAVQTALISDIATGYYNLLLLDAQMEVAQSNYELTKNTLRIVELQRDAGQITSLAIQQTRNQMLVAKALIPKLEQDIAIQENALSILTGQLPTSIKRDTKLSTVKSNEALTTGIPLAMLSRRPDVQSAQYELDAKNAAVGVAQTSRYPSLNINVGGGVNAMLGKNWFNIPGALFGDLAANLAGPLFNKKRLKTAFEVSKIERENAEIDLQKKVYIAITEVTDALTNLQTVEQQIQIAQEQVTTSRLGVKQSNLLFNSGFATYIEVINAQKNMLDSELRLNEFRQKKLLSRVKLYKSLGGGWD
ncbi:TolC family protein [Myroides sp. LJL116]